MIDFFRDFFRNLKLKFIEKGEDNDIKVLSPNEDIPKDDIYIESLLKAIKHKKALNIALSGPYGAGKSSIIESFKKHYKEFNCINISLANFLEKESNSIEKDKPDSLQDQLERSILKQLFYKVKYSKIPNSRFKRINEFTLLKTSKILILFITAMIPIILFNIKWLVGKYIECKEIILTVFKEQFQINVSDINFALIITGISLISLFFLVCLIKSMLNSFSIKSIKASKNLELNLEAQSDIKSFDKYIDEIMYFFKKNKYDVVFFEDLDRFNNIEIFTRLRELNNIINESEEIKTNKLMGERKVKFVYAIKDDIFSFCSQESESKNSNCCKNRTKFFDYIIPVIPKIDSNNSFGELKKLIYEYNKNKEQEDRIKISKQFINDISIFIDDMRLLTNTFNEFLIYYEKIKIAKNEDMFQKLFAIILYKNLYPSDFDKLKNKNSYINKAINIKEELIDKSLLSINESISIKKKEQEKIKKEVLDSFDELLEIYCAGWSKEKWNYIEYNYKKEYLKRLKIEDMENIESMKQLILYESSSYYADSISVNIEDFATINGEKRDFFERLNIIKSINGVSHEKRIEILENEINDLGYKKNRLALTSLKNLLKDTVLLNNFRAKLDDDYFEGNDIIFLFLRRGYVDEKYSDLISVFIEGKISQEEKHFLKEVICGIKLDLDYPLENVEEVIEEINIEDFKNESILNLNILKCIFENFEKYKINAKNILSQFEEINDFKLKAMYSLKTFDENSFNIFISECIKMNPKIFYKLCLNKEFNEINREKNFNNIIKGVHEDILLDKVGQDLEKYLLTRVDFINMDIVNEIPQKIINIINNLNIKFEKLDNSKNKNNNISKVVKKIYDKDLYCINRNMIEFLFNEKFYNDFNEEVYSGDKENLLSYSNIINSGMKNLIRYIDKNINEYLENILLNEENVWEEGEKIIKLINSSSVKQDNIISLINKKNFKIYSIEDVEDITYWKYLMENKVVEAKWKNIISYYEKIITNESLDSILIDFLSDIKVVKELSKEIINYEENEKLINEVSSAIILNMELSDLCLEYLIKSFSWAFEELDLSELPKSRVDFLVDKKIICLSEFIYDQIDRKNALKLIINWIDNYLNNIDNYYLEEGEIGILLTSDEITIDNKLSIIKELDIEKLELHKNYNIIENLISDLDDNEFLELKEEIKLEKIKLIIKNIDKLSIGEIKNKLKDIDDKYKGFLEFNSYFDLELDDIIIEFLDCLEKKGVSSSHKELNGKIRVYRRRKVFQENKEKR